MFAPECPVEPLADRPAPWKARSQPLYSYVCVFFNCHNVAVDTDDLGLPVDVADKLIAGDSIIAFQNSALRNRDFKLTNLRPSNFSLRADTVLVSCSRACPTSAPAVPVDALISVISNFPAFGDRQQVGRWLSGWDIEDLPDVAVIESNQFFFHQPRQPQRPDDRKL